MAKIWRRAVSCLAGALLVLGGARLEGVDGQRAGSLSALERDFARPPADARVMMRWWWFGPAVTKAGLARELRVMKEGGIGGVEVQPVYPVALDDEATGIRTLPYLSDEFIEALRFAQEEARALGLRFDLTIGSGWPYGGPTVPIAQASGRLRVERVKLTDRRRRVPVPETGAGEKLIAAFLARVEGSRIAEAREVTGISDGALQVPAELGGASEVIFFISSRTGQQVKRPSIGAEGYVLNHYDRAAIDHYLERVGARLLQAFGERPPFAVFCDSLEVYLSDWTPDLLEQFERRRGYDLKPHLPALILEGGPQSAEIRHDWGRTLTELLNERFLAPLRDWAARHQTRLRIQNYGIPPATIASSAYADLPEGEGAQWKVLRASRWASSASHLYGRGIASSETWTWLHSPSFRATPLDLKAEADLHFLQGINQLIGHGWPYTAPGVEDPGWRFYAAGVFNERNPWWIVWPDLAVYLQRLSYLMRQGQPANDVALYLPNSDAWASFSNGRIHMIEELRSRIGDEVVAATLEAGYNFDFFDDDSLRQVGGVEPGALRLGAGRYRVVILPNVERIPLDTLRKLEEFARTGGILIATRRRPERAPGFRATEEEQKGVRDLAQRLFEGIGAPAHFVDNEKMQLAAKLNSLLRPDVDFDAGHTALGFVHRSAPEAEIYFVANTTNARVNARGTFRIQGRVESWRAEWWDPFTGEVRPATGGSSTAGGMTIPLDLEPYGSRVVVFTKRALARSSPMIDHPVPPPLDLSADWRVTFGEGGRAVEMKQLRSWTEDEETLYFSGLAAYEKEFTLPPSMVRAGLAVKLDFGEGRALTPQPMRNGMRAWFEGPVREAAVVYVNGERAGAIWRPPYAVDVGKLLRPGVNRLRVVVGNTAINQLSGRRLPDYRLLILRYGDRFQPQDMDRVRPVESGLMGPIRLVVAREGE